MARRFKLTLLATLLSACSSTLTGTLDDIEQQYLFEIEYVNHAWGLSWHGLVIDREGNIYGYDHSHEVWNGAGAESYTEEQLQEKYAHESRYVARVDEATIVDRFNRVPAVSDQLSDAQYPCADAGALTYTAFRYDRASERYSPLLLRQEGDVALENRSQAGEDLAAWLRSLVSALEIPGVSPFDEGTCTP